MSDSRPWEIVTNPDYFRGILGNLVSKADGTVRFGRTGYGTWPNYQIETSDGTKLPYRGNNHERDPQAPETGYEESNLAPDIFDYRGVQSLLAACLERSR